MNSTDTRQSIDTTNSDEARGATTTGSPRGGASRRRNERGEGVISTAVAVLIVAFLGIGLWKGFGSMMNSASQRTRTQVEQIGR